MGSQNIPFSGPFTTNDLGVYEAFPAIQFQGTETGAIYYEDREVAGTIYRVQNATFNQWAQKWMAVNPNLPSYGFAITPTGAFQFVSQPAGTPPWSAWTVGWHIERTATGSLPQVGTVNSVFADGRTTAVTFAASFATSCSGVVVTVNNGTGSGSYAISAQVDHVTATGFNVYVTGGPPNSTVSITYLATGS